MPCRRNAVPHTSRCFLDLPCRTPVVAFWNNGDLGKTPGSRRNTLTRIRGERERGPPALRIKNRRLADGHTRQAGQGAPEALLGRPAGSGRRPRSSWLCSPCAMLGECALPIPVRRSRLVWTPGIARFRSPSVASCCGMPGGRVASCSWPDCGRAFQRRARSSWNSVWRSAGSVPSCSGA
jgi:hypothetical protein